MKSVRLLLVLFAFTVGCRSSGRITSTEVGTKVGERTQTTDKETSRSTTTLVEQEGRESGGTSAGQEEPEKKEIAREPERKPEKSSSLQGQRSELMSRLKGVRPETQEEIAAEEGLMEEITGLIIEQTMTKIGYDFYEYFFMMWEAPPEAAGKEFNIYIHERASPAWGSWVDVSINNTVVWSGVLRPRSVEIEDAVTQAIAATRQYFQNQQEDQGFIEEMVGTGI